MMRILVVASHAPSLQNFRGLLIDALRRDGHEVHVAAPYLILDVALRAWLEQRDVICHDIPLARTGLNPVVDIRSLIVMTVLMRRIRPDVFLGYTVKPVIWGLLAARLSGVARRVALITGLGYAFTGTQSGLRSVVKNTVRLLYGFALRQATLVFFQNPDDRDDFAHMGLLSRGMPVVVVNGSGVDLNTFIPTPFPGRPLRFLLIARLLGDKGIREYVTAAATVRAKFPHVECHLVGGLDPSPNGIPEAEAQGWHDSGDVIWHGALSDVRPSITSAHVYVLPSYREGTPRTVLEAMAMGRPVITTDAPGCRETVRDGENGFLVPPKDASAIVTAMEKFIQQPTLVDQMGQCARQIAEDRYDVHKVNAVMLEAMGI